MSAVRRPCVCRTTIYAEDEPNSIARAVRVHAEQPEHVEYMAEQEPPSFEVRINWPGVQTRLERVA